MNSNRVPLNMYAAMLKKSSQIRIVSLVTTPIQLIRVLEKKHCDVVLLISDPYKLQPLPIARSLMNFSRSPKLVLISDIVLGKTMAQKSAEGIHAQISRKSSLSILEKAICCVNKGKLFFPQTNLVVQKISPCITIEHEVAVPAPSAREVEIIRLVAKGNTNKSIANTLFISENTVKTHRKNINYKLQINNAVALTIFAKKHGIIPG